MQPQKITKGLPTTHIFPKRTSLLYRTLSGFTAFAFLFNIVLLPVPGLAQTIPQTLLNLPAPGIMVSLSAGFTPALVRGMTIHPDNPLQFDFFVSKGDTRLEGEAFKQESRKLIKYFLASLTVPEEELWVNLSPYEKDRIIPQGFGETEMGRDLLAQDYILKQLTASLMYPEEELGKKFWDEVYKKAQALYGTTEIPVDTFNKVWIVPEKAVVYEHGSSVFVVESRLKVMLEQDYVAANLNAGTTDDNTSVATEIIREIIIPAIEKEVNEGKSFASLRQIYNSSILAVWYKQKFTVGTGRDLSLLGQVYANQNKTKGIDVEDKTVKEKIYNRYLEAFKKGVYNYIKEDYDPATRGTIPRKYFSGGTNLTSSPIQVRLSKEHWDSYSPDRRRLILDDVEAGEYELVRWVGVENADEKTIKQAESQTKPEAPKKPKTSVSSPVTIDIRAYEKGGSGLAAAKMKILSELVEKYEKISKAEDLINEAESIANEELISLDQSTEGFQKVARGTASAEDKQAYLQSRVRGEWVKFLPAGGDAIRLGVKEQKALLDLKDLLGDAREGELEGAIEKALRKGEITPRQIEELKELRESVRDELKHKTIIARILESEARRLGGNKEALERQTYILSPSAGHEQKLADELSENGYFGFGRGAFFILPQEQEPKYQQRDGTIVAIDKKKAGGNGVPIINIVLESKGYTIGEDGILVKYFGKASEYAKQRGAKYIYQGTIGDLRPWIEDPLHEEFIGRIFGDLSSGKIAAAAEYAQQNPTLVQKGGTVFYNRVKGSLEFVEKLAMGRMLRSVAFEKQPLATFNHIFDIEALESIRGRRMPLYVRAEDGEFFTELVGGDIVNILQRNGYGVAHVERRVQIQELKGTASLIPTIRTAYMQDAGIKYLEKKLLTAVSLKEWIKGATPSDKVLPALIVLNKETNMENLPSDTVFSLVAFYRYFDPGLVESMLDHEGMWDFDVADRIFKRFKDVLTEHPELIDGIRERMAGRQTAGKPLTAVSLKEWIKGATPSDKALPALIVLNKETNMENLPADTVFSLVAFYRYFDPGLVESMLDHEGMWDFDVADRIFKKFKDVLTEHPELIDEISARAAASSPVVAMLEGKPIFTMDSLKRFTEVMDIKTVGVRVDFNQTVDTAGDGKRLKARIPDRVEKSIETLIDLSLSGAHLGFHVIVFAHQGRVGDKDYMRKLDQHAQQLNKLIERQIGREVKYVDALYGEVAERAIAEAQPGDILFFKNVRDEQGQQSEKDPEFQQFLEEHIDLLVQEAYSVSQRADPSVVGPRNKPVIAGRLMLKEIVGNEQYLKSRQSPYFEILGGVKASDYLDAWEKDIEVIDKVLPGSMLGLILLHLNGVDIGEVNVNALRRQDYDKKTRPQGLLSESILDRIRYLKDAYPQKIVYPLGFAYLDEEGRRQEVSVKNFQTEFQGRMPLFIDLDTETAQFYAQLIAPNIGEGEPPLALFWKGPLGDYTEPGGAVASEIVVNQIREARNNNGLSFGTGGGDTNTLLKRFGIEPDHSTTGGGAFMYQKAGVEMPGIESLKESYPKFARRLGIAFSPATGTNPELAKAIISGLIQNKIHSGLAMEINKLREESPDPAIMKDPKRYISDLFILAEAKFVTTIDDSKRTYFDYLLDIEKKVAKGFIESMKQKFKEGKLAISQEALDYFTENIEQAMVNLFNHDEMASLTRYSYFQVVENIIRKIYPDLYEDSKAQDFKKTDELYQRLRDQIKNLKNTDEALKKTMLLAGMSNILERTYFNLEHFQIDDDKIKERSVEIGAPFESLNGILNRKENKNGTVLIYLDNSGELPLNMLEAELLLDKGFNIVFVAKDASARDDLTISDVKGHLEDWLKDDRFDWLKKYYGLHASAGNYLRIVSSNSAIPGLNLASINDEHKQLRQKAILSIFHGGGNLYGSYPSALTGDSFYIYTIKEPAQIAIVEAMDVSSEKAKTGTIIAQFKPSGEKGHNLNDLLSGGQYFIKASLASIRSGVGNVSSPVTIDEEIRTLEEELEKIESYIAKAKMTLRLNEDAEDDKGIDETGVEMAREDLEVYETLKKEKLDEIEKLKKEKSGRVQDVSPLGGIDLNPALLDLQIRRDANFVPLPLPQQPIGEMRIDGFTPVIINITPVTNLPMLLGIADDELPADAADSARLAPVTLGFARED